MRALLLKFFALNLDIYLVSQSLLTMKPPSISCRRRMKPVSWSSPTNMFASLYRGDAAEVCGFRGFPCGFGQILVRLSIWFANFPTQKIDPSVPFFPSAARPLNLGIAVSYGIP